MLIIPSASSLLGNPHIYMNPHSQRHIHVNSKLRINIKRKRKKHKNFFPGLYGSLVVADTDTMFSGSEWAVPGSISIPHENVKAKVDRRLFIFSRSKEEALPTLGILYNRIDPIYCHNRLFLLCLFHKTALFTEVATWYLQPIRLAIARVYGAEHIKETVSQGSAGSIMFSAQNSKL